MSKAVSKNNQMVGNIGLFYTCYRLSKLGWNAMPTSRNARGIDIIMYGQDGIKKHTVQVKSLTKRSPVPIGSNLESLFADYLIICRNVFDNPEMFVTTPKDVYKKIHKGQADGRISYWLQPKDYEAFKDNWNLIGSGF